MDGTPRLLTDVRFSERRRGYDPEEVDNFLEKVSAAVAQLQDKLRAATARAEDAEARATEAARARSEAEAELAAARSTPSQPQQADPESSAEEASSILRMAQRTADAAVADARTKAAGLIREAEEQAGELRAKARAAADAAVNDLENRRDQLQGDVEALSAWIDEQRGRLRNGIDALQRLVDDPSALRTTSPPTLVASARTADDEGGPPTQPIPVLERSDEARAEPDADVAQRADDESSEHSQRAADETADDGTETAAPADASQPEAGLFTPPPPPAPPAPAPSAAPAEGDPLGNIDEDADAAMRAFFDADFDEQERRRFGRRR